MPIYGLIVKILDDAKLQIQVAPDFGAGPPVSPQLFVFDFRLVGSQRRVSSRVTGNRVAGLYLLEQLRQQGPELCGAQSFQSGKLKRQVLRQRKLTAPGTYGGQGVADLVRQLPPGRTRGAGCSPWWHRGRVSRWYLMIPDCQGCNFYCISSPAVVLNRSRRQRGRFGRLLPARKLSGWPTQAGRAPFTARLPSASCPVLVHPGKPACGSGAATNEST